MSKNDMDGIPMTAKVVIVAAKELGLPGLALLIVGYVAYSQQMQLTAAIQNFEKTMIRFQTSVGKEHEKMQEALDKMRSERYEAQSQGSTRKF